ncbi:hypothetical protein LGV61_12545 [Desulfurispirillum indicum]|nr:hypothetical protein [Desulfurispirillum indicum]UCZ56541.1 hypothetical protein LGV61_12545 [Desulfurispirillum indicum]
MLTKLYNSKFIRNVAIVASGTAAAQAITMAFAPIITRIYGPEIRKFGGKMLFSVDQKCKIYGEK